MFLVFLLFVDSRPMAIARIETPKKVCAQNTLYIPKGMETPKIFSRMMLEHLDNSRARNAPYFI